MKGNVLTSLKDYFVDYFSLSDYLLPQAQAEAEIREGVSFRGISILILVTAIFIASLGLNTNSTAVIIGAMLISPLMGPIIGAGLGVGIYDFALIQRSLRNFGMATALSIATATVYFLISPVGDHHSELLARTSPTIYDVLIAFFGGAAGILAAGSRYKGNVVPGVAIATALMPPLCTVGYGVATAQPVYIFGALYLFIINSVYIALATFIGVKLMKWHGLPVSDAPKVKRVRKLVYAIAILVMLPSVYLTYTMLRQNNLSRRADRFVAQEMQWPDTKVLATTLDTKDGTTTLTATLIGRVLPKDSLILALTPRLGQFGLTGVHLNFVQGDNTASLAAMREQNNTSVRDVYQLAQATITQQQVTIDSLRNVMSQRAAADTVSANLVPEIKVLFPEVADIAVSRSVFGNTASGDLDTVNVALVKYRRAMGADRRERMRQYLQARLREKEIRLVTVTGSL